MAFKPALCCADQSSSFGHLRPPPQTSVTTTRNCPPLHIPHHACAVYNSAQESYQTTALNDTALRQLFDQAVRREAHEHHTDAALASPLPATGDRDDYLRAWRGIDGVVSVTSQDSAATAAMAKADCLILRPAQSPPAQPGDRVTILPL